MIFPAWVRYGAPLLIGLLIGWKATDLAWDADSAMRDAATSEQIAKVHLERGLILTERELRRAALKIELDKANAKIEKLDADIASGAKRVFVRAKCPAVPAATSDASGIDGGTAELDPSYRPALSQLRRRAEEQLNLLKLCRQELLLRSAKQ